MLTLIKRRTLLTLAVGTAMLASAVSMLPGQSTPAALADPPTTAAQPAGPVQPQLTLGAPDLTPISIQAQRINSDQYFATVKVRLEVKNIGQLAALSGSRTAVHYQLRDPLSYLEPTF